jgi:hypothetical protein
VVTGSRGSPLPIGRRCAALASTRVGTVLDGPGYFSCRALGSCALREAVHRTAGRRTLVVIGNGDVRAHHGERYGLTFGAAHGGGRRTAGCIAFSRSDNEQRPWAPGRHANRRGHAQEGPGCHERPSSTFRASFLAPAPPPRVSALVRMIDPPARVVVTKIKLCAGTPGAARSSRGHTSVDNRPPTFNRRRH